MEALLLGEAPLPRAAAETCCSRRRSLRHLNGKVLEGRHTTGDDRALGCAKSDVGCGRNLMFPQIRMSEPNPQCDGVRGRGLWEVMRAGGWGLHEWD